MEYFRDGRHADDEVSECLLRDRPEVNDDGVIQYVARMVGPGDRDYTRDSTASGTVYPSLSIHILELVQRSGRETSLTGHQ
jgi:hypothetical protein